MQIILSVLFTILLLFVFIDLYKKNRICKIQEKQIGKLQQNVNNIGEKLNRQKKTCQEIWDAANTIHLYASLSEEETQSKDLKVKQSEIRQLSEKIISLSDNRV